MGRDPYQYFRIEARELLDQLNRGALDLEKNSSAEHVAKLLRWAHTLKGAARVVKCAEIADCAHAIEDTLAPLRGTEQQATRSQIDTLLRYMDAIGTGIAGLSAPPSTPSSAPLSVVPADIASTPEKPDTVRAGAEKVLRTVRIDIGEMDKLLDGVTEVHSQLGSLRDCLRLAKDFDGFRRNVASSVEQLDRELKLVRDAAEKMRLIPAENLFFALERAARDAAQFDNKQVVFEGRGGAVRLDAQVLDTMQGALAHAVRNAVVHGIEIAAERTAAAKSAVGEIVVEVSQRGRHIVFTCTDDGRGINFDAIRQQAEQRGLLTAGAQTANTETLLQLLLKGGISTSGTITEVAGRGVGLDVVRDAVERLEGKIDLRTEEGRGTTLTLSVPLSLAALEALQVESAGVVAIIPLESVQRTLRIAAADLARTTRGESLIHEGESIPFLPLVRALSGATAAVHYNRTWSVVIVKADCGIAAIGVDRLLGASDIMLRPLPALAPAKAIIAGVSLDMEGNPQLVLDPQSLVMAAQRADAFLPPDVEQSRLTILVIDDSLTTRMLERSILESAGYVVELAVSGEEALEKASRNRYALFLVDVEMPGMDGFTFIERTRADPALRDTPAILVTSRVSEEDLQRGRDVGASGHIAKSEFDQGVLLMRIGELVR